MQVEHFVSKEAKIEATKRLLHKSKNEQAKQGILLV